MKEGVTLLSKNFSLFALMIKFRELFGQTAESTIILKKIYTS